MTGSSRDDRSTERVDRNAGTNGDRPITSTRRIRIAAPSVLPAAVHELIAAARRLRARPGYLLVTSLTLALGIGAATLVFTLIDAIAFDSLPYGSPERLTALYERSLEDPDIDRWPVAPATYEDWRGMVGFRALAAYTYASPILTREESARRVRALRVTGNAFGVLDVRPARGRTISENDVEQGEAVAILSHGFWMRALGGDEDVVGREIVLDGEPTTVIGVMSPDFRFPYDERIDMWIPLRLSAEEAVDRTTPRLFTVGRLAPRTSLEEVRQEAEVMARRLATRHPETHAKRGINVVTMREDWLEWRRPALLIFAAAAAVALFIALLNLAGLMLSRGLARRGEVAVRSALGAGALRIAWTLVAEGLWVALLGAGMGAVLAAALLPLLTGGAPQNWAGPLLDEASLNARALTFSVVLALGSACLASLAPYSHIMRGYLPQSLRQGGRSVGGRGQLRVRRGIVLAQTALAVALLAVAGVLGRSLLNALHQDIGLDFHGVFTARVPLAPDIEQPVSFYERLEEELSGLPQVDAVTLANIAPLSGDGMPAAVTTDGSEPSGALDAEKYNRDVQLRIVTPDFFQTLAIPLVIGRGFEAGDVAGAEPVAIVNREFVRALLPSETDPLEARLRAALTFQDTPPGLTDPHRIVGVVGDVAEWGVWLQPPIIYVPFRQMPAAVPMTVLLRSDAPPAALAEAVREASWRLGNRWPVDRTLTMEAYQARLYDMNDFMTLLMGLLAALALLLAATGLYAVVSFQVALRTRELALRQALGATTGHLLRGVAREGVILALLGVWLAGLAVLVAGRWIATSWLGNFLVGVSGFDPVSFLVAAALLTVIAGVASLVPAHRAARVDPALSLQAD